MLRHALLLAFRNFMRHRSSFFINLIGLATGLAGAILIFLWVNDEMSIDKLFEHDNRLFQVMEHQAYAEGLMTTVSTPGILAETLAEEVPEVQYAATIMWNDDYTLSVEDKGVKKEGNAVGADFFRIFSFDLIRGEPGNVLKDMNAIVLSESTALALFPSIDEALGKSLEVDRDEIYTVTGIYADMPVNSSFRSDFLTNFEKAKKEQDWLQTWSSNGPRTVVLLTEGADYLAVSEKIADFIKQRHEESHVQLFLKPYSERYLWGRYENGQLVGGRIDYVYLFSVIAIFILIIACINFMNLSTARASRRAREVGVKKAVGAERGALISQYLSESTLIAFLSLGISLVLVYLALPEFNLLTDKEISLRLTPPMLLACLGLTLLTGLLAGSYPAFYLSSFQPVQVLKGEIRTSLGEIWARRGLVVFQFTLSVILIVAVFVVYQQIQYVHSKNLGYDKDQLLYFGIDGRLEDQLEAFLSQARDLPGISAISSIGHGLVGRQNNTSGLQWEGKNPDERILFEHVRVNYGLMETIGVNLLEGRFFSEDYGADSTKLIFNQRAIEIMGMTDPIGQKIRMWDEYDFEIIGVVENFHFQSLHEEMNPLFFRLVPDGTWLIMAKLEAGREKEALGQLGAFYEKFNPGFTFDFDFLDEQYALMYAAEQRVASLSKYFAAIAILISCLGLLGLAAFTADRKKKEIGIRKVLGASAGNIMVLLTRDFTRLVLVSLLIGLPVSYFVISSWLNRFAYRIELNPWFFLLAGVLVLAISWITVSSQAIRSATINPKECLREE